MRLFITLIFTCTCVNSLKRYSIDLDLEPSQRWNEVIKDHASYLPNIINESKKYVPKRLQPIVWWVSSKLLRFFPTDKQQELIGCTSIVAQSEAGRILHGRNLDYDMTQLLKNITVYVDFNRNNSIIYSGITFVLYNGLLTGQRPYSYSISLNARYSGAYIDNILMELFTKFKTPVSYLIRDTLEKKSTYHEALRSLSNTHLFSPSYIIIAGVKSDEGAIISRNRWKAADVYHLDSISNRWFLVETNFDHWKTAGDDRRISAINHLKKIGKKNLNESTMMEVISTKPILNDITVYSTIISAASPDLMFNSTIIR